MGIRIPRGGVAPLNPLGRGMKISPSYIPKDQWDSLGIAPNKTPSGLGNASRGSSYGEGAPPNANASALAGALNTGGSMMDLGSVLGYPQEMGVPVDNGSGVRSYVPPVSQDQRALLGQQGVLSGLNSERDYLGSHPLESYTPTTYTPTSAPSIAFPDVPVRANVHPDIVSSALGGILGLVAPQYSGQLNAAPIAGAQMGADRTNELNWRDYDSRVKQALAQNQNAMADWEEVNRVGNQNNALQNDALLRNIGARERRSEMMAGLGRDTANANTMIAGLPDLVNQDNAYQQQAASTALANMLREDDLRREMQANDLENRRRIAELVQGVKLTNNQNTNQTKSDIAAGNNESRENIAKGKNATALQIMQGNVDGRIKAAQIRTDGLMRRAQMVGNQTKGMLYQDRAYQAALTNLNNATKNQFNSLRNAQKAAEDARISAPLGTNPEQAAAAAYKQVMDLYEANVNAAQQRLDAAMKDVQSAHAQQNAMPQGNQQVAPQRQGTPAPNAPTGVIIGKPQRVNK